MIAEPDPAPDSRTRLRRLLECEERPGDRSPSRSQLLWALAPGAVPLLAAGWLVTSGLEPVVHVPQGVVNVGAAMCGALAVSRRSRAARPRGVVGGYRARALGVGALTALGTFAWLVQAEKPDPTRVLWGLAAWAFLLLPIGRLLELSVRGLSRSAAQEFALWSAIYTVPVAVLSRLLGLDQWLLGVVQSRAWLRLAMGGLCLLTMPLILGWMRFATLDPSGEPEASPARQPEPRPATRLAEVADMGTLWRELASVQSTLWRHATNVLNDQLGLDPRRAAYLQPVLLAWGWLALAVLALARPSGP